MKWLASKHLTSAQVCPVWDSAGRCFADRWDSLLAEPCAVCVPAKALASRGPPRLPAYAALVRECVRCDAQQRCAHAVKTPPRNLACHVGVGAGARGVRCGAQQHCAHAAGHPAGSRSRAHTLMGSSRIGAREHGLHRCDDIAPAGLKTLLVPQSSPGTPACLPFRQASRQPPKECSSVRQQSMTMVTLFWAYCLRFILRLAYDVEWRGLETGYELHRRFGTTDAGAAWAGATHITTSWLWRT